MKPTNIEAGELIPVQYYYNKEGGGVYIYRKIADGEWEKILTPYAEIPEIRIKYMTNTEISELVQEKND